jgi:hypothetical protein
VVTVTNSGGKRPPSHPFTHQEVQEAIRRAQREVLRPVVTVAAEPVRKEADLAGSDGGEPATGGGTKQGGGEAPPK